MWRKQSNLIQPDWWETTSQNVLAHVDKNTISHIIRQSDDMVDNLGNDSNLLIVFYVQIMPDDFVMQLHRF
ncbi:hypothetical protein ESCOCP296M_21375 [Escherichia coli]|nr:hypothetical protein CQA00_22345 [Escherichia coli]PCR57387.1 hypothetical protein CQA71_22980 [Escherichia coli]GCQ14720.1 GntR family transcriptional regulator [Escherichia coli]